jgi:prepilin peptidase CpaA
MSMLLVSNAVMIFLLLAAAAHDLATRTLPNSLAMGLAALSFSTSAECGKALSGLEAGMIVFSLATVLWRCGLMGGGDVKLLGAVALGIMPAEVPGLITAVALGGGVVSLCYIVAKLVVPYPEMGDRPTRLFSRLLRIERWRIHRGCPLPYACAIAAGTLYVQL